MEKAKKDSMRRKETSRGTRKEEMPRTPRRK